MVLFEGNSFPLLHLDPPSGPCRVRRKADSHERSMKSGSVIFDYKPLDFMLKWRISNEIFNYLSVSYFLSFSFLQPLWSSRMRPRLMTS